MLNLLALLVDRNRPLTLRQVRQELGKQYPSSNEAARAAFERDKAALREMGIPIETKTLGGDSAGEVTYWVNRSNYELSDLKLSDDERIALQLAVATVRLGAQHGEEALWKLGGEKVLRPTAVSVNIGFVDQNMSAITDAVMQRRTLDFDYNGEKRQVDPYGMLSRSGFWYLIGFDHLRKDQRVFRIDRIEVKVTASTIRAFKTPVGFDVAGAVPTEKQMMAAGDGEITTATVLVDAALVAGVRNEFGGAAIIRERGDGSVEFAIPCANMSAFRLWLFAMVESAEVLAPAPVREQVMQWLEELAAGK
jgi:proteasome accessory factor B